MKDSEVLKPCQRSIQSQVGLISSSSRPLSPQQKAWWGRTKADPSGNSYKKHPKNTQQALARSLHLPSLKLTAKESPGGRKFGLCPTCKCAVWGAVGGKWATNKHCGFRGNQHKLPATLNTYKGQELGLTTLRGIRREVYCRWSQIELPLSVINFPWAAFWKQRL